jgi:hypothetical protein
MLPALVTALALAQPVGVARNALDFWTARPAGLRETGENLKLSAALKLASRFGADESVAEDDLRAGVNALAILDAEVARLRAGLAAPRCVYPKRVEVDPGGEDQLAEIALVRAVVGLHRGEDVAPLVLDVIALGHRVARCEGTTLLRLDLALRIEKEASIFVLWASRHHLLSPPVRMKLLAALVGADALKAEDLQRVIDLEIDEVLAILPPASEDGWLYSRAETERRLRAWSVRLREGATAKDFDAAVRQGELLDLVGDEEAVLAFRLLQKSAEPAQWLQMLRKSGPPPVRDLVGRLLVREYVTPIVRLTDAARWRLGDARDRRNELSAAP